MGYIVNNDLILGSVDGVADMLECLVELKNQPLDTLRVINNKVVDAREYKCFYIDPKGIKHIVKHDPAWYFLKCNFDEELINDSDTWRVKTDADKFAETKIKAKDKIMRCATDARITLYNQVDPYQLASWNDKARRAERILAKTASKADIAILKTECEKRGKQETPQQLARKQITKSEKIAEAIAKIDGISSVALEMIKAKRSVNTLNKLVEETQKQIKAVLGNESNQLSMLIW